MIFLLNRSDKLDPSFLNVNIVRSILFVALTKFIRGESYIRIDTINRIIDIMNNNIEPEISIRNYASQMINCIEGNGHCKYNDKQGTVKEALKSYGINVDGYELTENEKVELSNPLYLCLGLTITGIYLLHKSLIQSLSLSALAVEVYQSSAKAYEEHNERTQNHKGYSYVCQFLRVFLAASSNINNKNISQNNFIQLIPQIVGPTLDLCDYALKSLVIDLNNIKTLDDNITILPYYIQNMNSNIILSLTPIAECIHSRIYDMSEKYGEEMNDEFKSAVDFSLKEVKNFVYIIYKLDSNCFIICYSSK